MSTPTPLKLNLYLMPSGGPDSTLLPQMKGNKNSSLSCRVVLLHHCNNPQKFPLFLHLPDYLIHF